MNRTQMLAAFLALQVMTFAGVQFSGVFSAQLSGGLKVAAVVGSIVIATFVWAGVYFMFRIAQYGNNKTNEEKR